MLPNNRLIFTTIHLSVIVCLSVVIKSIEASSKSSTVSYDNGKKFTIQSTLRYFPTLDEDDKRAVGTATTTTTNGSGISTSPAHFDHPSSSTTTAQSSETEPNDFVDDANDDMEAKAENSTTTLIDMNINLMNETNDFDISYPNDVDCSEFTEQKLMNIVICSTEYINNATSNNLTRSDAWNSSQLLYADELNTTNIPNDTSMVEGEIDFDSTAYLVQVVTTSVILGIIILATVIGKLTLPQNSLCPPTQVGANLHFHRSDIQRKLPRLQSIRKC